MRRRNRLKAASMATLLAVGGAYALASWDWCPRRDVAPPRIVSRLQASGPLEAGAATAELEVPFPIVAAGYGPPRPLVSGAAVPLLARAVVLREQNVTFGLVSIDLLLVPGELAEDVRARSGLGDVWVVATHSHSSLGGYDPRLVAQLAGTGRFRADARAAVVEAAVEALQKAAAKLTPVTLETGHGTAALSAARSGAASETGITRVRFGAVAEWLMLAAHPTLAPRALTGLDPDYPGRVASDAGVALVLQTAVGNARAEAASADEMALKVRSAFDAAPLEPVTEPALSVTRVQLTPPPADATRLVPRFFAMPGKNFLCASAPRTAEVGLLRLGELELFAIPAEVTFASSQALGVPVLSLANGYLGYVEPAEAVDRAEGESKRQYYDRELLDVFQAALKVAR